MNTSRKQSKNALLLIVLFLPFINSQCPQTEDISPCKCTEFSDHSRLSCWGDMQLSRLTTILRDVMCGKTIDKFELIATNISYLPSNLFSRMILNEINVYSANIQRFTLAGRSAFYRLEGILSSLSMRRCFLIDNLQWQMLVEMYALSYLDLSYNQLTRIPIQWEDQPPPNLRSLLLKGNKISTIAPGALKWMYSLVELDLSENSITTFSRASLPLSGNSLIVLRVSYNRIENITEGTFDGMFALKRIYVDNNNLTNIEQSTWRPVWGDLDALDLNGNDLQCDNFAWMPTLRPPVRLYGECAGPSLRGKHLKTLTIDHFES